MKALILAAGYAVRLYPLTKEYPKPLLPVNKRAIIDYIVDKLNTLGPIDEIIVVTNSRFISKFKEWAGGKKFSKPISILDDLTSKPQDKLGAIGDIAFSINKKQINDDLLVIGGDNLFDESLDRFIAFVKENKNYNVIGIYDIKDLSKAVNFGVVRLDKKNKVVDFKEKPLMPESSLVAMCLYYFPKAKLKLLKEYFKTKTHKRDATGFYIDFLRRKDSVYGFVFGGKWYDIGEFEFYKKAKGNF